MPELMASMARNREALLNAVLMHLEEMDLILSLRVE
jgi:hypothetical protein